MIELKFNALKSNGQIISGILSAPTYREGKLKVNKLIEKHHLKLKSITKKSTYIYKIKRGNEAPVKGEQRAYSKEEVIQALTKLGYQVVSVKKFMFEWDPKPPAQEVLSFVKISAELLEQKLPYSEIMILLINDLENKTLRETLKQINSDLKKGADSQTAFLRHERTFGKFTAYMLGLAAKSGNMTEIYKATAKFLERNMQFQKDLRSALITPMITLFVLFLAVLFYVMYIFPETAKLFVKFDIPLPPMTAATLAMSAFLMNNWFFVLLFIIAPPIGLIQMRRTKKGRLILDRYLMKMPVMGSLIHKTNIEVFCRVFYTLYSGSAESIEPIRIAAEATDNKYFEKQIKGISIPLMINKGIGISEAFKASGVFTDTALSRFHSGEETGTIKNTALQLANYYESETVFRLKNVIEMIQVMIAMVIMVVMIGLTLVSAETATINPRNPAVT
ncbi:MAG: type II secretion system F family protein [Melioribacteraceae bacterium]|nr:type II secretion system F family protein [Melioribacteraceae bacterium]